MSAAKIQDAVLRAWAFTFYAGMNRKKAEAFVEESVHLYNHSACTSVRAWKALKDKHQDIPKHRKIQLVLNSTLLEKIVPEARVDKLYSIDRRIVLACKAVMREVEVMSPEFLDK